MDPTCPSGGKYGLLRHGMKRVIPKQWTKPGQAHHLLLAACRALQVNMISKGVTCVLLKIRVSSVFLYPKAPVVPPQVR